MPYKPLQDQLSNSEELIAVILSYTLRFEIDFFQEIDNIMTHSSSANPMHGITGVICFSESGTEKRAFQYLEGPSDEIDQLLVNISKDKIIEKMKLDAMSIISKRKYPWFAMNLVNIAEFQESILRAHMVLCSHQFSDLKLLHASMDNFREITSKSLQPKKISKQSCLCIRC